MEEKKGSSKAIIGIVVVVILVVATTATVMLTSRDSAKQATTSDTSDSTAKTTETTTSGTGTNNASTSGSYKDGSFTAQGSYQTPGGRESIEVKLTLADGVITDASVTQNAISPEAHEYQAAFVSGYKTQVIGKKIDAVSLSRVAGSSLTPGGFNSALDTIKSQAQA